MKNNKKYLIPLGLLFGLGLYMATGQASINEGGKAKNEQIEQKKTRSSHEAAEDKHATTTLRVWATAGPLAYLENARVLVKNNEGDIIGKGKTNPRGTSSITLQKEKAKKTPLHISISGGKEKGLPFTGHLSALATATGQDAPVVFLDLLSTVATQLVKQGYTYPDAKVAVRDAFGISKTLPEDIIRTFNNHVSYARLQIAERNAGGFDKLIHKIVLAASAGRPFAELKALAKDAENRASKPSSAALNTQAITATSTAQTTTVTPTPSNPSGSASPVCTTGVPNQTSNTSSTQIVSDLGAVGIGTLLDAAGASGASVTGATVVGMVLAQPSNQAALTAVANELDCISSQINAVSEQITGLLLQVTAGQATACQATLKNEFYDYTVMVNAAIGAGNEPGQVVPINASNSTISGNLIPNWNSTEVTSCGAAINDMLFGNAYSGTGSYWLALNQSYQNAYTWYTQAQVQTLQSDLSYWSTYSYYAYVLQNEYYNWMGPALSTNETQSIQELSGANFDLNGNPEVTAENVPICSANAITHNTGFCIYQSNMLNAFPGDLYSDEIGFWATGLAVNAIPAGSAINMYNNHGDTVMQPGPNMLNSEGLTQIYQHVFNWHDDENKSTYYDTGPDDWNWYSNNAINPALALFNAQGINPGHTGSAIQTFSSPQAVRTMTLSSTYQDMSLLKQPQTTETGALTAKSFFNSTICDSNTFINSIYPCGQPGTTVEFYTNDTSQYVWWDKYINQTDSVDTNSSFYMCLKKNTFFEGQVDLCDHGKSPYNDGEMIAVLTGRNFWPAAASAIPPAGQGTNAFAAQLPTPVGVTSVVPGEVTINSIKVESLNSISLSFKPFTLATTDLPVTYTATCDGTGTFTATSSGSPITVSGLSPNETYTCSVAAVNAVGAGLVSNFPNITTSYSNISWYRIPYPSEPTNFTASYYNGYVAMDYKLPIYDGGSAITGYAASCVDTSSQLELNYSGLVPNSGYTAWTLSLTIPEPATTPQWICSVTAVREDTAITNNCYNCSQPYTALYGDPAKLVIGLPLAPNNPHWWSTTPGMINLSYSAPSIASASPISGYSATCTATGHPNCSATAYPSTYTMSLSCALGVEYQCSVAASNNSGIGTSSQQNWGTQSELQAVTVAPAVVPDAPTNVSLSEATTTSISASFTDGYDGGSSITNHLLTCTNVSNTANLPSQLYGPTSPITLSSLTAGATYDCIVQAQNSVGLSLPSTVSAVTLSSIVPGAPTITSLTATNTSITANFNENNVTLPITKNILTCTNKSNGVSATSSGTASPITLSNLTADEATYSCALQAEDSVGSSLSSAASIITLEGVPGAPTNLSLTSNAAAATMTATFTAPSNNGGVPITDYYLFCTDTQNGSTTFFTGSSSPLTAYMIYGVTTYSCVVKATNAYGYGLYSTESLITVPATSPPPPTITSLTATSSSITASVIESINGDGGSPITGYNLMCTNTSNGVSTSATSTASPITLSGLTSAVNYSCAVQAQNAVGSSPYPPEGGEQIQLLPPPVVLTVTPQPPTNITYQAFIPPNYPSPTIKAIFTASGPTEGGPITGYRLTCSNTASQVSSSVTGTASPITFMNLLPGLYSCTMQSESSVGFSTSSAASIVNLQ